MNYGRAIKIARAARGLSQKELASLAGYDASYVSLLESGARVPSAGVLEALSGALRVPVFLLTLLASDENELRGITPMDAEEVGRALLELLLQKDEQDD